MFAFTDVKAVQKQLPQYKPAADLIIMLCTVSQGA